MPTRSILDKISANHGLVERCDRQRIQTAYSNSQHITCHNAGFMHLIKVFINGISACCSNLRKIGQFFLGGGGEDGEREEVIVKELSGDIWGLLVCERHEHCPWERLAQHMVIRPERRGGGW